MMNLKPTTIKTHKRQAGLTLLELTVVLLVLIGLSGLILPYAQGYLQKTHDSTGSSNLAELNKAIQMFATRFFKHPDGYHTLIDDAATSDVYGKLMKSALVTKTTYDAEGQSAAQTLPLDSLRLAGISKVWNMNSTAVNATFDAASTELTLPKAGDNTTTIDLATVAALDLDGDGTASVEEHLAAAFRGNPNQTAGYDSNCYDYVVFGVGPESEMVGKVMADAPLHFASKAGMGPADKYNRFVVVYQVDKDNTTAGCSSTTEPAKLVGAAMLMMKPHLWGTPTTQQHAFDNLKNNG